MKKFLFSFIAVLAMVAFSACSSNETEKKLDGKWTSSTMVDGQSMDLLWDFDAASHKVNMTFSYKMEGATFFSFTIPAKWSATPEKITMTLDADNVKVDLSDAFVSMSGMSNDDIKTFTDQMSKELVDEIGINTEDEIVELTDSKLVVKEHDQTYTFTR